MFIEGVGLSVQTAPAAEPVTTAEAKSQLRVDHSDDDTYIDTLVKTARMHVEMVTGRSLINQTLDESFDAFPASGFILGRAPVSSVTSVTYYDEDETSAVVTSSLYQKDLTRSPAKVLLLPGSTWPTTTLRRSSGVVIRYVAGYGATSASVPAPLVHAVKLIVADLYRNREDTITGTVVARIRALDRLLDPYRVFWL